MITFNLPTDTFMQLASLAKTASTTEMSGLSIIEDQDQIKSVISTFMDVSAYHYGNIFSHIDPFTTHADISEKKRTILLIPIQASDDQSFVVFDQTVDQENPVSWIWNLFDDKTDQELADMYYLTALKSRPCEHKNVKGLTNEPCPNDLFEHLPYTQEFYYGLTGKIFEYNPGNALMFPATHLHATGRMASPKIGCTVQFSCDFDQAVSALNSAIEHSQF